MINLGELVVKVRAQTGEAKDALSDFKEKINDTELTGKEKFKALGGTIKNFAKIAGKALMAAGAVAVVAITKDAIKAYGEYEQLSGGIEKIFGDTSDQIMKDSKEAYKTMGMSQNEYMDNVVKMGSMLKASMGEKDAYKYTTMGLQAVSDFASATGRDASELNDKLQSLYKGTGQYQSLADNFAGILPATSQGFLEAAQNAGFLGDEYKSLTEVPVDEYQAAVSQMLEKGTKDLGVYGNTAAEAEETLTGSFDAMKASYENFVTALGTGDDEAIQESIEAMADTAVNFLENLLPLIGRILTSLIKASLDAVCNLVYNAFAQIGEKLGAWLSSVGATISGWFTKVGEWISGLWQKITNFFVNVGASLATAISGWFAKVGSFFTKVGNKIASFFKTMWGKIKGWVTSYMNNIKSFILNPFEYIKGRVTAIWEAVKAKFGDTRAFQIAQAAIDKIKGVLDKVKDAIKSVGEWWDNLKEKFKHPIKAVVNFFKGGDEDAKEAGGDVKPLDWKGVDRVPWDNYEAILHRGERVLTNTEANQYDKLMQELNNGFSTVGTTVASSTPQVVTLNIDGKEFARFMSPLMNKQINLLTNRSSRLQGVI